MMPEWQFERAILAFSWLFPRIETLFIPMQRIVLLGATGSIGDQTLNIISRYPDLFQVVGMSARANGEKLLERADEFQVETLYLAEGKRHDERQVEKMEDLIDESIDHLIVGDHGLQSFQTVLKALALRKRVSIANKELLIAHGQDLVYFAREQQAELIPLDSEHNGLFQALKAEKLSDVRRLIITASGGPFRDWGWNELSGVTVDQVLKHPTWRMGRKTTVDSATLVNKAFEVIETHHLFGIPYEQIEVRLHPQSLIHSIVEFKDGNTKVLVSKPDMRFPIGYALFYPERAPEALTGNVEGYFDFDKNLELSHVEPGRFPCFDYVLSVAKEKPQYLRQIIENDEFAVHSFLRGEVPLTDILPLLKEGIEL
jgi:1-deoxy-D-xylulose-5-phosphate reductoisomerase